jgi:phosphoribosylformylglycinamidine synthase
MPYGGSEQLTPPQYMAAKLPVPGGKTDIASVMSFGFDPYISEKSPYHGAYCTVVESAARLAAAGVPFRAARMSFQEYFRRMGSDAEGWGIPFSALLGAYRAQLVLGIAAIGGKDSMSGTFEGEGMPRMDVPPTLVSFAIAPYRASKLVTPEFKRPGVSVYLLEPELGADMLPTGQSLAEIFDTAHELASAGAVDAMYATGFGGIAEAIAKMCFGNMIGFRFAEQIITESLTRKRPGALIIAADRAPDRGVLLGHTVSEKFIYCNGEQITLDRLVHLWSAPLERVFPTKPEGEAEHAAKKPEAFTYTERHRVTPPSKFARPRVVIPVFPGTNCEYDSARAFEAAGGEPVVCVLRNLTPAALEESLHELAAAIDNAQILMLPGGFSGGDEPDGSGKFITAVLRSPIVCEAVTRLLDDRLGLVLGICNGFQALVKSGLLPDGRILPALTPDSPTLTYNRIGRHQSMMVTTRIASVKSPWMRYCEPGELHTIPVSHGEGRFTASAETLAMLAAEGRIATQYVDPSGIPSMETRYNPNGSDLAIEGIFSPDGRIFGKMGHSERCGENVAKNVPGNKYQPIFKAGIDYYK